MAGPKKLCPKCSHAFEGDNYYCDYCMPKRPDVEPIRKDLFGSEDLTNSGISRALCTLASLYFAGESLFRLGLFIWSFKNPSMAEELSLWIRGVSFDRWSYFSLNMFLLIAAWRVFRGSFIVSASILLVAVFRFYLLYTPLTPSFLAFCAAAVIGFIGALTSRQRVFL